MVGTGRKLGLTGTWLVLAMANSAVSVEDGNGYEVRYEAKITLPECNSGVTGNGVKIISSSADWRAINDWRYRVFCVTPGDYRSAGQIVISRGGTRTEPRWIRWYDPDNPYDGTTHPVHMAQRDRAIVRGFELRNSEHVRIDRLSIHPTSDPGLWFRDGYASGNGAVVNRVLVELGAGKPHVAGALFRWGHHEITIQNSVFRSCAAHYDADNSAIANQVGSHYNRFVNNEIYDCTDGIVLVNDAKGNEIKGTIIENNDLYVTPAKYSDSKGNPDPDGEYMMAENAIDIKAGTSSGAPRDVIRIINNRIWGYRPGNPGSIGLSGDPMGSALNIHRNAASVLVQNNIFFSNGNAIAFPNDGPRNVTVVGNLIYDTHSRVARMGRAITAYRATNSLFALNTIVNAQVYLSAGGDNDFLCNLLIGAGVPHGKWDGGVSEYNAYFETRPHTDSKKIAMPDVSMSGNAMTCFYRKLLTAKEPVCFPGVRPTAQSPHTGFCRGTALTTKGVVFEGSVLREDPAVGDPRSRDERPGATQ